jgi:hypothetical protein
MRYALLIGERVTPGVNDDRDWRNFVGRADEIAAKDGTAEILGAGAYLCPFKDGLGTFSELVRCGGRLECLHANNILR